MLYHGLHSLSNKSPSALGPRTRCSDPAASPDPQLQLLAAGLFEPFPLVPCIFLLIRSPYRGRFNMSLSRKTSCYRSLCGAHQKIHGVVWRYRTRHFLYSTSLTTGDITPMLYRTDEHRPGIQWCSVIHFEGRCDRPPWSTAVTRKINYTSGPRTACTNKYPSSE